MNVFQYNELQESTNLTPLMIATVLNQPQLVDELLLLGADVNEVNSHEETALHLAFQEGNADILEELILMGGDLKAVSFTGNVVYQNLQSVLALPGEKLMPAQVKMRDLALKYAPTPLTDDELALIQLKKEENLKRQIEGMSPSEMTSHPKQTDIAKFFIFTDKEKLLKSVKEYIGYEKFKQRKELQSLLGKYPISLMPTPFMNPNEESLVSNKLLKRINTVLPPHRYLSSSWFKLQQASYALSDEEKEFVDSVGEFLTSKKRQCLYVQQYPSFDNILKIGFANCGELASACLHEQLNESPLVPLLQDVSFLRANIKIRLPKEKAEKFGFNPSTELQHVFLICEEGKDKSMDEMVQNLSEPKKSQALDIWKRRAGYAHDLIISHMMQARVSYAELELIHPKTQERMNLALRYFKDENKLVISPVVDVSLQMNVYGKESK